MGGIEYSILSIFKERPEKELSTSEIVKYVFKEDYTRIEDMLKNPIPNKERVNTAKKEVAKLHRKILYYLNNLLDEEIIKIEREGKKGQKFFRLALDEGEELHIGGKRKRIIISKTDHSSIPIEGYEQKKLIFRFDPATWINRVNSILIDSLKFKSLDYLHKTIVKCFSNVNDVIALNCFEKIIEEEGPAKFREFIERTDSDCEDFGKAICLILKVANFNEKKINILFECIKQYEETKPKHIRIIFDAKSKELQQYGNLFENIITLFSSSKIKLYIKNDVVHSAPFIIGKGGPYTFDEDEWKVYAKEYAGKPTGIVCSQSSFALDVDRIISEYRNPQEIRSLVLKLIKTLFLANSTQRRKSGEYFTELNMLNRDFEKVSFIMGRNYIRLWNYGSSKLSGDKDFVMDLLQSMQDEIKNFCHSQEIIYTSCGMPIRFNIAFSCALDDFSRSSLSQEAYKKIIIKKTGDLHSKEIAELLSYRENIAKIFSGGDRVRVYRTGDANPGNILKEMTLIMNTYSIPFFCYDFGDVKGSNLKLQTFFS